MNSVNKSVIAVSVFGALFAGVMSGAHAADIYVKDESGLGTQGVFIRLQGQDESVKSYDLDKIDSNTTAINTVQGVATDNADKITSLRGDLTAEANERVSNINAVNSKVDANATNIDNVNADLQANKTLLSARIDTAQTTANDADSTAHTALAAAGNAQITANNNAKDIHAVADQTRINSGLISGNTTRIEALENQPKPKDGADGKNGVDGKAGKDGVNGKDGKNGLNGSNGKDGVNGKNGVTTTITKKEVDTKTIDLVKSLNTQTTAQAKDLNAAKSFFNTQTQHANQRMNNIEEQQNSDRKEYRAGIAGAASIAGLHYVDTDNAVAIGAANFKDQQGYAIGYRHKFAENVAATLSTSGTSNGDEIVAASASIGW